MTRSQRIRDPIHDIVVFDGNDELDTAVWNLLQTPELQRLRRIKQLGVAEFVYPAATHTRFIHSIGVFNYARRLIELIDREVSAGRAEGQFDKRRAKVAILAAVLHDIGHGPFSHAFEQARKSIWEARKVDGPKLRKHEAFTAEMIERAKSQIGEILQSVKVEAQEVANLIRAEVPEDMYHAVVSSSFDADRLDYLQRDRYMAGVESGAIDLEWLMDNVRVANIDVSAAAGEEPAPVYTHSFCLSYKARDAAEDFLLARYRLYANVYFHKTVRGIEQLIAAFFRAVERHSAGKVKFPGLDQDHLLMRFFASDGESLENYLRLDDSVIWHALQSVALLGKGYEREIAICILERRNPHCLDVQVQFPDDRERQRRLKHQLDDTFRSRIGNSVFKDAAKLSLYGAVGADDERAQNRLMIQLKNLDLKEITDLPNGMISGSDKERSFDRYYFLSAEDRKRAEAIIESIGGRQP